MAGFFQQLLKGAGDGFFGSPYLKDFTHASKTFVTDAYANAPKFKWLFHVYFDINQIGVAGDNFASIFPKTTNLGLLVKSIDLPKFSIALQEMNQYNRKRYIQTKINYDPVRIVFHDDNANQVKHLWHTYYSYYYYDTGQPFKNRGSKPGDNATVLARKNIYDPDIKDQADWGYAGELTKSNAITSGTANINKSSFFKAIRIYGFNQHNFALYELINPIIENFSHDNYNYYDGRGIMENTMTVKYESVKYYDGALNGEKPDEIVERFAEDATYDKELSPLSLPGSTKTIMGKGGLAEAGLGVLEDLSSGNILGAIQTAGRAGRTFKNSKDLKEAAKSELTAGIIGAAGNAARGVFNIPAAGASTGSGSQSVNRNNSSTTQPNVIPVDSNRTINSTPGGP